MELFIQNLNPRSTKDDIEEWLTPILRRLEIHVFDIRKPRSKPFANLTVTDATKAQRLISETWTLPDLPHHPVTKQRARFTVSRHAPNPMMLKVLRKEEEEWNSSRTLPKFKAGGRNQGTASKQQVPNLKTKSVSCGRWEISRGKRLFVPYFTLDTNGTLLPKGRSLMLRCGRNSTSSGIDIVFDYVSIQSIVISNKANADSLVLTLSLAPKVYEQPAHGSGDTLARLMSALELDIPDLPSMRISSIPGTDRYVCGTCLVYHLGFQSTLQSGFLRKSLETLMHRQLPFWSEDVHMADAPKTAFSQQVEQLNMDSRSYQFAFTIRFQLEGLWANGFLSPEEVRCLLPVINSIRESTRNVRRVDAALRFLHMQLRVAGPGVALSDAGLAKASQILRQSTEMSHLGIETRHDGVPIHRVTITPAGTYLYGPDKETPNRILRQYAGHEDCFIRVSFADESGDQIRYEAQSTNEKILRGRFLKVLQQGIRIADEQFDFLGFSHSSLRSQTCWFMRPFIQNGEKLTARAVIALIGDFSHIQCPAKCAARIGQAFSDTEKAISVDAKEVYLVEDIKRGRFTFTDGCGTISQALWKSLKKLTVGQQPTLYQIRYQGAKGMISLNTSLQGRQMQLRSSMVKFTGSPSNDLEICGTNARPLEFRLNRQIIKILEDLGVNPDAFALVQEQAMERLRRSARSPSSAIDYFCSHMSDNTTGMTKLVSKLTNIGIDVVEDQFVREIIRGLIEIQLRDLKFRTRIPVTQAVTLYGICDETGFLGADQVFVTYETADSQHSFLEGTVAVTRSPALHPGDVRVTTAVEPPTDSPLRYLTNCIVFSQKGMRDMPSMLAGGDLDGDIFGIIWDDDLIPKSTATPAEYEPVLPVDVERAVTADDMTKFFVDFMETDQLGRIATLHQVYADTEKAGTFSDDCLKLAALHSAAVDFSKSGRPIKLIDIPKTQPFRPDFMAPNASTKVHRGIKAAEAAAAEDSEDSHRYRYYESDRVLGKLYRSINEDEFFEDLQDDNVSIFSREGTDDVVGQIWEFVLDQATSSEWEGYLDLAREVKEYYETIMSQIQSQYATGTIQKLTEKEVLIGTIIGRSGASNKHQKEQSEMMKARYKREIQDIRQWMKTHTDDDHNAYHSLAIACLSLCVPPHEHQVLHADISTKSFAWFAAAICVPKLIDSS